MSTLNIHISRKVALLYGVHTHAGMECLHQLIDNEAYSKVIVLSFQSLKIVHKKLKSLQIETESLEKIRDKIQGNDLFIFQSNYFKKESETERFVRNNYLIPLRIAIYAKHYNVNQVSLLSSSSTILKSFFLPHKTREELERSIKDLDFWSYYLYKPTLVIPKNGDNVLSEAFSSFITNKINAFSGGLLDKIIPVEPSGLVSLMIKNAQGLEKGCQVFSNEMIILQQKENNL